MEKYRISSKTLAVLPISKNRTKVYENDDIIILQTCSTLNRYSKYKHKFLVIVGKLVS